MKKKEIKKEDNKVEASKYAGILIRPRITEKATFLQNEGNVYTFEIGNSTTKKEVAKAIKDIYKVTPLKIRTIMLPRKKVLVRGKIGSQSAIKKALVYLKKGDKIDFA